ncbi:MAG: peroxiredoxin [Pseudomonadota bacterium]
MLTPGTPAPDFKLPGPESQTFSLSELIQEGPVILYFYPADFTPGCTKEACAIRDIHDDIQATGLRVVGISAQDEASHKRFAERYELPFLLLSDPEKKVTKAYDLDGPLGIGSRRGTFLIDEEQTIQDAVLADIRIDKHIAFIQKAMALQT